MKGRNLHSSALGALHLGLRRGLWSRHVQTPDFTISTAILRTPESSRAASPPEDSRLTHCSIAVNKDDASGWARRGCFLLGFAGISETAGSWPRSSSRMELQTVMH